MDKMNFKFENGKFFATQNYLNILSSLIGDVNSCVVYKNHDSLIAEINNTSIVLKNNELPFTSNFDIKKDVVWFSDGVLMQYLLMEYFAGPMECEVVFRLFDKYMLPKTEKLQFFS